jgi:hypothetical protein
LKLPFCKEQSTQPKRQGKENHFIIAISYRNIANNDKESKPRQKKHHLEEPVKEPSDFRFVK